MKTCGRCLRLQEERMFFDGVRSHETCRDCRRKHRGDGCGSYRSVYAGSHILEGNKIHADRVAAYAALAEMCEPLDIPPIDEPETVPVRDMIELGRIAIEEAMVDDDRYSL